MCAFFCLSAGHAGGALHASVIHTIDGSARRHGCSSEACLGPRGCFLSQTQNLSQFCALCRELGSGGMFIVLEALEAVFNFDVCGVTKCVSFMRR